MTTTRLAILAAAVSLSAMAGPVMAQTMDWSSYQLGNQRNYTGYDQNGNMWTGSSYNLGNRTNSTFYGPGGQMTNCSSYQLGNRTNTSCY
jgi:hypothetical protein